MANSDSLKPTKETNSDSLSPSAGSIKNVKNKKPNISKASQYTPKNEVGFNEIRIKKDKEDKARLNKDEEYAKRFSEAETVYQKILGMISDAKKDGHAWGWKYLEKLFKSEISDYNYESVMQSIANFNESEVLTAAERACFASSQNEVMGNISYLATVIKGSILTAEEAKEISDINDKDDSYTDYSE